MREQAGERAAKYLEATTKSLRLLKIKSNLGSISSSQVDYVLELARGYVKDSKHYLGDQKPVTSLACIAYAEGLLDALKFLQLTDF